MQMANKKNIVVKNIASKNKRILVIPDIHNEYRQAEKIIKQQNPDHTVFLGDYFDSFDDNLNMTANTAEWLKKSLSEKRDRTHLFGNHDVNYMPKNTKLSCSGFSKEKRHVVNQTDIDWNNLHMYCWIDSWLCTHAGMSYNFLIRIKKDAKDGVKKVLDYAWSDEIINNLDTKYDHPFFNVSKKRGGSSDTSGPLWCDYSEFIDVPGTKQIFGHTPDCYVRHGKKTDGDAAEHYCIDTALHHCTMITNDEVSVIPMDSIF